MERISCLASPSPVLAVIEKPDFTPDSLFNNLQNHNSSGRKPLYLALDGVKDPGNLGTIIRVADWFGIDAIFASPESVEIYNPKVVQATMGAIFRKQVIYTDLDEVCRKFSEAGLPVYGTFLDGENIYNKPLSENGLIIMGNEGNGVTDKLLDKCDEYIYIPMSDECESLNVGVATSIILYELL